MRSRTLPSSGLINLTHSSRVRVTRSVTQTFLSAATDIVEYNVEDFDNLGEFANYRFTAMETGYYSVTARIVLDEVAWSVGKLALLYLYKNAAPVSLFDFKEIEADGETIYISLAGVDMVFLSATDFIDIRLYHDRGGDVLLYPTGYYNYFAVHRLS